MKLAYMVTHLKTGLYTIIKTFIIRALDLMLVAGGFILFHQWHVGVWSSLHVFAAMLAGFSYLMFANAFGVYRAAPQRYSRQFDAGFFAWVSTGVLLLILTYATKTTSAFSRVAVGSWFLCVPIIMWLSRQLIARLERWLLPSEAVCKRIAVAGVGENAARFAADIAALPQARMEIAAFYYPERQMNEAAEALPQESILGDLQALVVDAANGLYDEIYIALPMTARNEISFLIRGLTDCSVPVFFVPDVFSLNIMTSHVYILNGLPVVAIYDNALDVFDMFIKRVEDIVLSLLILSVIAIPMLVIALIIRSTSSGTILFKQQRCGMGGELIEIWKFRSMTVSEAGDVMVQAKKNDPRVTPFGAFLRRTSLDELPQFFNVLRGDMSIVGPRPHPVAINQLYRDAIQGYMLRHLVKPGITGWAQVNGWRGETDTLDKMEKRIQYDLEYMKHWSIYLDLKIIVMTIFRVFSGENAY